MCKAVLFAHRQFTEYTLQIRYEQTSNFVGSELLLTKCIFVLTLVILTKYSVLAEFTIVKYVLTAIISDSGYYCFHNFCLYIIYTVCSFYTGFVISHFLVSWTYFTSNELSGRYRCTIETTVAKRKILTPFSLCEHTRYIYIPRITHTTYGL